MAKKKKKRGFYSTDPNFELPFADLSPKVEKSLDKMTIRIWLERKHRGGKEASIVKGLEMTNTDLKELAKELKSKCGTGGSVVDGDILIQGDHRAKIKELLEKKGAKNIKLAGS